MGRQQGKRWRGEGVGEHLAVGRQQGEGVGEHLAVGRQQGKGLLSAGSSNEQKRATFGIGV